MQTTIEFINNNSSFLSERLYERCGESEKPLCSSGLVLNFKDRPRLLIFMNKNRHIKFALHLDWLWNFTRFNPKFKMRHFPLINFDV